MPRMPTTTDSLTELFPADLPAHRVSRYAMMLL